MSSKIRVVTIGGGGGHAQILKGLKTLRDLEITAICPSTDSGGSTGVLRQEYNSSGYLGDLTKCFVALCQDETLAKALMFRYEQGCLHGHSVKNILFLGLEQTAGLNEALSVMGRVCGLGSHRVMPVTTMKTELCAMLKIGNRIRGETQIDHLARNPLWHPNYHAIEDIYLSPNVEVSRETKTAIEAADWVVICPGDLFSSVLPVILPVGVQAALEKTKIVVILNIMTKQGETDNYKAMDFVSQIERRIHRPCDVILVNSAPLPEALALNYALEEKVQVDPQEAESDPRVILAPLAKVTAEGFLYHDPELVAQELAEIFVHAGRR